jgi:NitT/TauT family transport system substrate-binding protein
LKSIVTAYDIMGGPVTGLALVSTEIIRGENPKAYAAVLAAYDEALAWIGTDKRRAAKLFLQITKERKVTEDEMYAVMTSPDLAFTKSPSRVAPMLLWPASVR